MKNSILTGAAAALAMTIGFAGDARAQCYWTAYGYQCPAPGYSQPNFGWGIVGSGLDARPGFAGDARAQCYWTAYGYQCPAPGYSQPNFGWGIVGSGFDARPDSRRYRGLRPDAGYPGPALVGSEG